MCSCLGIQQDIQFSTGTDNKGDFKSAGKKLLLLPSNHRKAIVTIQYSSSVTLQALESDL